MISRIKAAANSDADPPAGPAVAEGPWARGNLALPRVSVIISSYNYADYIEAALDSVAAQTYANLECVSRRRRCVAEDDSVAVVGNLWLARTGDRRFRLIAGPSNRGQLGAVADGLAATDGEFRRDSRRRRFVAAGVSPSSMCPGASEYPGGGGAASVLAT